MNDMEPSVKAIKEDILQLKAYHQKRTPNGSFQGISLWWPVQLERAEAVLRTSLGIQSCLNSG